MRYGSSQVLHSVLGEDVSRKGMQHIYMLWFRCRSNLTRQEQFDQASTRMAVGFMLG